jgi:hypothetical protein
VKPLYTISVPGGHPQADGLITKARALGLRLDGSYISDLWGEACVQFRLASDEEAAAVAIALAGPSTWRVHTGYGIHQRLVAVSPAEAGGDAGAATVAAPTD